jgi:hypothetical protein
MVDGGLLTLGYVTAAHVRVHFQHFLIEKGG